MATDLSSGYEDYSNTALAYDKFRVPFGFEIILGALARYAKSRPLSSLNILEAGCGTGNYTKELCRYVGRITAVDNSNDMLARARSKLDGVDNVTLKNVDLRKLLPFDSGEFDAVVMILVIHHLDEFKENGEIGVENLQGLITEVNRVLKTDCEAPLILAVITKEQYSKCQWFFYYGLQNGFSELILAHAKRFLPLNRISEICALKGFEPGPRIVPTSETTIERSIYFEQRNVLTEEFRRAHSSWRDFDTHEKFPQLLEAYKRSIENKEMDKWVKASEEIRVKEGMATFLIFYKNRRT